MRLPLPIYIYCNCMGFSFVATIATCKHLHWIPYIPLVVIRNRNCNRTVWAALNTSTQCQKRDNRSRNLTSHFDCSLSTKLFSDRSPPNWRSNKATLRTVNTWVESWMYGVFGESLSTGANGGMSIAEARQTSLWIFQLEVEVSGFTPAMK